ncbi:MAG TPA: hypothetical protein VL154_07255 [Acetobacteraceae bacterium]|jgi:enoyl-CoA hydratase/carnithine racemase|nr:hypothetical protein [Acetobacteraceae bacterium]
MGLINEVVPLAGLDARVMALAASIAACFDSADYNEGRAAFRARRRPVFRGR